MNPILRGAVLAMALSIALLGADLGHAQNAPAAYPQHPVRMIVPFPPGGPADICGRLLAQKLSQSLGQQVYVENQAGAGGNLGMGNAARAAPDGHTMVFVSTSYVVNPSLYPKLPYDPIKDFAPVTLAGLSPNVLVVHPSIPATNVKELIAFLKANPAKYSIAHAGVGTTPHLSAEMFKQAFGLDVVTVPFSGSAPAVQSALAGHTPIAFAVLTPAVPLVKDGKLRACGHHALPFAGAAGSSDARGSRCARRGSRHHAGHSRSGRHAEADRRAAQPRDPQGDGRARRQGKARRARLRARHHHARRIRRPHQGRHSEMGEGDPRRQHQARAVAGLGKRD
jgi:tripartite-type tricarboxylate transporter receptor subunit TctC